MVRTLLVRGLIVGAIAGLLSFGFLKAFGEPAVDQAIGFETAMDAAMAKGMDMPAAEEALVSRPVQAGIGLFTGVMVYSAAFGGLYALVFAFAYGRIGTLGPRALSALIAGGSFMAIYAVPNLKYPANPPSVGQPGTIGMRTELYFAMIALSIAAMVIAIVLRKRLLPRFGGWNATLIAGAAFILAVAVVQWLLPAVNEVPDAFPAVVLWQFRLASAGAQLVLWGTMGLLFGGLTERAVALRYGRRRGSSLAALA